MANTFFNKLSRNVGTALTAVGGYTVASDSSTTVVVVGLLSPKYSAQTRLSESWSERSVQYLFAVTMSENLAPTASRPFFIFSSTND